MESVPMKENDEHEALYRALTKLGYRSPVLSEGEAGWIRMDTKVGTYALWRIENTSSFMKTYQMLARFSSLARHLMPYLPFANGRLVLEAEGHAYVLSPHPQGENAASLILSGDTSWIRPLMRVLAMIHRESALSFPTSELKKSLRLLSERWKEEERQIKTSVQKAQHALYPSPVEAILVANADDLLHGMSTARAGIDLYLQEDALPVSYELVFAHGALSLKNVYFTRQGIHIIDWRQATVDAPARDLGRILREVIQFGSSLGIEVDLEGWLKTYELIRPLSVLDRQLFYVALYYPHEPLVFLKKWWLNNIQGGELQATRAFESALDQYVRVRQAPLHHPSA
ncbi:MAG: phosphotransferase [Candidatus Carbobacillus altaicus]|nr:phosphotransferase [Candidatus Carbobacillus altaicus]